MVPLFYCGNSCTISLFCSLNTVAVENLAQVQGKFNLHLIFRVNRQADVRLMVKMEKRIQGSVPTLKVFTLPKLVCSIGVSLLETIPLTLFLLACVLMLRRLQNLGFTALFGLCVLQVNLQLPPLEFHFALPATSCVDSVFTEFTIYLLLLFPLPNTVLQISLITFPLLQMC